MLLVGACFRRGETSFSSLSRDFSSSSRSSQDLQNLATYSLSEHSSTNKLDKSTYREREMTDFLCNKTMT
jgi:hypothetical protein